MNEFGDLLYSAIWSQKPQRSVKKLEKMIIEKKEFLFTKEEFINFYLLDAKRIGNSSEIDFFQFDFFNDSYDAVTFRTTDYSTIQLLRERLSDFNRLINEV